MLKLEDESGMIKITAKSRWHTYSAARAVKSESKPARRAVKDGNELDLTTNRYKWETKNPIQLLYMSRDRRLNQVLIPIESC